MLRYRRHERVVALAEVTQSSTNREEKDAARDVWTTQRLLVWMTEYLTNKKIESPRLHAEILLSHVFECERLDLYTSSNRPASRDELNRLRGLVARAARHEPVAHLTGEAWFFGLKLEVNPSVLIPRPSTETIVEFILQREQNRKRTTVIDDVDENEVGRSELELEADSPTADADDRRITIADIGTGSGCVAIALAVHLPNAEIVATDISGEALETAKHNAAQHRVRERIRFSEGSLYDALDVPEVRGENSEKADGRSDGRGFDYVISNPPYISDGEWEKVEPNVADYEPVGALRAGVDGMDFLRPLIGDVHEYLSSDGGLGVFEIAASQSETVRACARRNPKLSESVQILRDLEGHPRVFVCERYASE